MAYNFPSSPTLNQLYTYQGYTWSWNGQYWRIQAPQAVTGATGATGIGATGATGPAGAPGTPGTPGSGGGGAANVTVRDEGTVLTTAVSSINFVGAGVSSSASGDAVTVTISGGGGGGGSTLTFGNTVPANPQVGDRWINSEDLIELVYVNDGDNSFWLEPAGGSGGGGGGSGNFTYGNTAPVAPAIGDRWMDSDNLKEFVYIYDGDSYAWVEPSIDAGLVGATGATGPQGATGAGATGATGPTGLGFTIAKSYASVALLLADTAPTGIVAGQFGIVETGNVENAENSRLYLWSGTAWSYVTDLSGAQGITGPQGATGIQGNVGPVGATGPAGTSANIAVYDEGSLVTGTVTGLNFVGAGITANTVSGNVQITVTATGTGSGGGFQYANTAPASPQTGDRWLDSDSMIEYVYVNDGDSSQWVEPITRAFSTNLTSVSTHVIPDSNVSYDLGTSSLRWRDLYLSGNSIILGAATLSATGSAVNLPAGSTVGGQNIPSSGDVATGGGGPKITNVQVTNSSWTVIDDTAVDTAGGYVKITGTNFVTGCQVVAGTTTASAVSFVSGTELRVQFGAIAAGTYILYVSNPDGGVALRVNGITFSASPSWQTGSSLGEIYDGVVINLGLVATEATSYVVTAGSLPPGLTLNANTGVITGTVTGITVDTTYNFTVTATDPQNQDSPRAFSVTVTVSDPYFKLTSLLLSGSAISANTVIRDSSTNNFNLTVFGDARASNFTPYSGAWSVYFDGTGDYLQVPYSTANDLGTGGNWTVELWVYMPSIPGDAMDIIGASNGGGNVPKWHISINMNSSFTYTANLVGFFTHIGGVNRWLTVAYTWTAGTWYHIAATYDSTNTTLYVNGQSVGSQAYNAASSSSGIRIGSDGEAYKYFTGYISNCRVVKGTAVYTANFTPATTNLTSVANTSLLTCHTNRFLDSSTNNFAITRNGDARVTSFNPFNITNTGVNGSAYFDGTGDYLTVAGNSGFAFGTGDFTIECWVNPDLINTATFDRICATSNYNGTGFDLTLNNGAAGLFLAGTSYGISSIPIKAWSHLVYTRSGTTVRGFLNGKLSSHTTGASQDISSTATLFIAHQGHAAGGSMLTGYLADLRLIKGSIPAAYQTASTTVGTQIFTPPAQPLTAISNTQLLTLQYRQPHNNHTFLDSSSNQFVITRNGNASQGTFSPFSQNGWSAYFDGSYDCIKVASDAAFGLGTGNFTIELWVNFDDYYAPQSRLAGQYTNGNTNGWQIYKNANSYNLIFNTNTADHITYNWSSVATNTWYHIAVVRSGTGTNQTIMYINGVNVATGTCSHSVGANQVVVGGLDWAASYSTKGYISSFRYSNIARTIVVPTVPYSSDANTLVLTCQSNRFIELSASRSITIAETPKIQAFSPFAPTAVYSPAVHGGSGYFDGTGDYLSTSWNSAPMGTEDFCIEFWVYPTAAPSGGGIWGRRISAGDNFQIYYGYPGNGLYLLLNDSTIQLGTATTPTSFAWTHYAYTREGTTLRNFINGVLVHTLTGVSTSLTKSYSDTKIGWADYAASWTGYISSFRIVRGSAVYNANFTLSTTPGIASASTAFLLNFTDTAILDSTGRNVLETVGDAKTSSVVTKFTGGAMYFDGTGDWTIIPTSPNFGYGTGDFTIEFWMYWTGAGTQTILSNLTNSSSSNPHLWLNAGVLVYFTVGADRITGSSITANQWYHVALSRASGSTKLFVNGTQSGSTYADSNNYGTTAPFGLGTYWNNGTPNAASVYSGYIADLRITRGYARYTANFTPPTGPARLK